MSRYTTEYKDALYHLAKLYNNGSISYNTMTIGADDIGNIFKIKPFGRVITDLDTLLDAWDKYEVLG